MSKGRQTPEQQFATLAKIWDNGPPGFVFLPWIPGSCARDQRRFNWNEGREYEWRDDRPDEKEAILEHIRAHQKDELYFTPSKFLGRMRKRDLVDEGFVLYADLDEVDPSIIDSELRPSVCWESSPDRYQAVWLMRGSNIEAYDDGGVNQRLTRYLGADPSGWDATQVLRVPGKLNYKPEYRAENDGAPVPGALLWDDGPQHDWETLGHFVPSAETLGIAVAKIAEFEEEEIDDVDRHSVWSRVRLKVSKQVRDYMAMRPHQITSDHDRSDIIWQISCDLADAGCTVPEIIAIIKHSPWNKFEGRGDELFRLKMGAVRAVEHSSTKVDDDVEILETEGVDEQEKPNEPLWLGTLALQRIPRPHWLIHNIWTHGSCGFISGQPKSYKSWIALDMAISVALGKPFLNDPQYGTGEPQRVLYLQEEDNLPLVMYRAEQIIEGKAPERHWHGPIVASAVSPSTGGESRSGTPTELVWMAPEPVDTLALHVRAGFRASDPAWQAWLADFVREHRFALVVIDTLGTTVGDIDTDKAAQLNERVLRPLKQISEPAEGYPGCAIAIVHHNRKSTDANRSGQQMLGSVALHAWVESALYVQSKEKLPHRPLSEVKLERENKMAEDLKLKIQVPTMHSAKGHEGGDRQVWQPIVTQGWGEESAGEQAATKQATPGRKVAGQIITDWVSKKFGDDWVSLDLIVAENGQNRASIVKQLTRAVANDLMSRGKNDTYRVMS